MPTSVRSISSHQSQGENNVHNAEQMNIESFELGWANLRLTVFLNHAPRLVFVIVLTVCSSLFSSSEVD